jgi:hypothetical protein
VPLSRDRQSRRGSPHDQRAERRTMARKFKRYFATARSGVYLQGQIGGTPYDSV